MSIFLTSNNLLMSLVFFMVCFFIFRFSNIYMNINRSVTLFMVFYSCFLFFMIVMTDITRWYTLIVRWEIMRVSSFYLISWFNRRSLRRNRANLAILINRFRDLFLFMRCLYRVALFFLVAIFTKSSMWIFSSWLPNAMERPTPVSTLLHSSTMVVARVFVFQLVRLFSFPIMILFMMYGTWMRCLRYYHRDYKRIIAYSTSSQLVLVRLFYLVRGNILSIQYVLIHAFFKSLMFMICRWMIHGNFNQWVSSHNNNVFNYLMWRAILSMIRMPFLRVSYVKDLILQMRGFMLISVFMIYAFSTMIYSINLLSLSSYSLYKFLSRRWLFHILCIYMMMVLLFLSNIGIEVDMRLIYTLVNLGIMILLLLVFAKIRTVTIVDIYYKRNMRHFDIIRSLPFSFNIIGDKTGMTIRLKVFLFLSLIFFL